ncbi:MAG: DUF2017 family protein [Microcella sp.]
MRGFQPHGEGYQAVLEPYEARVLLSLAEQLQQLLSDGLGGNPAADEALHRVLPDAYRNDDEAAREWRELSRRGLIERKSSFAATMTTGLATIAAGDSPAPLQLSEGEAIDWMRAIGDLRLILADRLGIVVDGDEGGDDPPEAADLYRWLAWIQDDLVRALDGRR